VRIGHAQLDDLGSVLKPKVCDTYFGPERSFGYAWLAARRKPRPFATAALQTASSALIR